ncbi:putative DNA binding domain-containing protein [Comamonas aquatica]|uniref:DNA binding domain-containing protein n=1 Tax=Comamonas aquatica TaxID=225991 RepID=A0AA43AZ84_9BURK|nr:ATP-binding protein [Comamonas aquatica]MDH1427390.1 putative DNA binding domain-containing protein [Comamonas aquatica]MDH1607536.1 putative DNA binding domain-containing protein [Comamonas aquatica]MDH1619263.1 putative DNA binding domain-containing protein [Comamonas aquatica]MDH2007256.1 putative DNA binding domain-containing protein [Comamonas aquatica]
MTHLLPTAESLTVEFKSDRKRLPDSDLVEALVCLANAEGGELWLGVEDDGTPTGLHMDHRNLAGLAGLVAARTSPSLRVQVDGVEANGLPVARITVPKAQSVVSTVGGVYLRRRLKQDGTPECTPMLPHERESRAASLGLVDVSAQPVAGATLADLDPLERERLRQAVQQYGGDRVLLELDDEALDGALGLTARQSDGARVPTLTGLLLVGRETSLHQLVPTHEFAFQVLAQQAVRFNEFRRFPLLKALDWLETNFRPYNPEDEIQVGLFRVPVPMVDMAAFREAVANALIHRDYHRLGAVHVRLEDDALAVSNPGGLVDGVTLANLLVTEPRPRNRALADAMKRVGVVERSGRGVDTIFRGMLKFGRPSPDYSRTDAHSVVVRLPTEPADLDFRRLVVEEERRRGAELPIDSLIALAAIRELKRVTAEELADRIQRDAASAKRTLEALTEAGLVQAHGNARGRSYTLSAAVYQAAGDKAGYTRQAGFTALQNEQLVLNYVRQHGRIRRAEVMELCRLSEGQAKDLIKKLKGRGALVQHGERRSAYYTASA